MTFMVARLLFPFSLMLGAALWAKGYSAVGEGFSAGAAAGLGAVIQFVCLDHDAAARAVGARWAWHLVACGLMGVVALVLGPVFFGLPPVTHFPAPGAEVVKLGILEMHTAVIFDLAVALLVYGSLVGTIDRLFPPFKGNLP